jgi:hypothetical protein
MPLTIMLHEIYHQEIPLRSCSCVRLIVCVCMCVCVRACVMST